MGAPDASVQQRLDRSLRTASRWQKHGFCPPPTPEAAAGGVPDAMKPVLFKTERVERQ